MADLNGLVRCDTKLLDEAAAARVGLCISVRQTIYVGIPDEVIALLPGKVLPPLLHLISQHSHHYLCIGLLVLKM